MIDNEYYCPECDLFLTRDQVKEIENNGPTCKCCKCYVQSEPDPPYDHTGHDTLEEKNL